jgi:tetratricopeptide (TPR) repeat protein
MPADAWTALSKSRRPSVFSLPMKDMEDHEDIHGASQEMVIGSVKPLTAGSKRSKELELKLLESLEQSDESIDPLIDLWTSERQDAAPILRAMEEYCSPGLQIEEAELRNMIDCYGMEWAEPMARLALVLFTKRQYDEAAFWCRQALEIKPWHFEVGRILVVVYLRQERFAQALKTARKHILPSLNVRTQNKRRKSWVEQATMKARQILTEIEVAAAARTQDDQLEECPVVDGGELCWG